jgi:succinate-acetate transporter protein
MEPVTKRLVVDTLVETKLFVVIFVVFKVLFVKLAIVPLVTTN